MAGRDGNGTRQRMPEAAAPGAAGARTPARPGADGDVAAFLRQVAAMPPPARAAGTKGRLIFALDATASRQPTWDRAQHIQGEMFEAAAALGGLDVQLLFYRGFGECKASPWVGDAAGLLRKMTSVTCLGGHTQIAKVLAHARRQTEAGKVDALIFVGDAMEEDPDHLCHMAGELGLLGVPVFMFHEGGDPVAGNVFRQIAKLSRGAYCPFDSSSAQQLKDLLRAVAVYAAGGRAALQDWSRGRSDAVLRLTRQIG